MWTLPGQEFVVNEQSYFQNSSGSRASVGNYGTQRGFNISLGFYKPVRAVKGLMLGGLVRNALTGSQPENGGYAEGYYFNFLSAGLAAKYYPGRNRLIARRAPAGEAHAYRFTRIVGRNLAQQHAGCTNPNGLGFWLHIDTGSLRPGCQLTGGSGVAAAAPMGHHVGLGSATA